MGQLRIAVVGAGITGLGGAWLLGARHEVTLFEKEDRIGGHSHTVDVPGRHGQVPIDTGFIVYNTRSYPNLIALFQLLDVPTVATDMSFSVSLDSGRYEYNGNGALGFFGQPLNLLRPSHWQMGRDTLRFFREAANLAEDACDPEITLGAWLRSRNYSRAFIDRHILPMAAAIWSAPAATMLDFPAAAFARFFANHGLLQLNDRPQWRTVEGGSRAYVDRIVAAFRGRVIAGDPVVSVERTFDGVAVATQSGTRQVFDRCLLACHADDALSLLQDADATERDVLGAFRYERNEVILHRDARVMPRRRWLWTSWNYVGQSGQSHRLGVSYWMNKLQPLGDAPDYFVTLNPTTPIPEEFVARRLVYHHPLFDVAALQAQARIAAIQGRRHIWFAGSYCGYGFHEDGLAAGLEAAEAMGGVHRPWVLPAGHRRPTLTSSSHVLTEREERVRA